MNCRVLTFDGIERTRNSHYKIAKELKLQTNAIGIHCCTGWRAARWMMKMRWEESGKSGYDGATQSQQQQLLKVSKKERTRDPKIKVQCRSEICCWLLEISLSYDDDVTRASCTWSTGAATTTTTTSSPQVLSWRENETLIIIMIKNQATSQPTSRASPIHLTAIHIQRTTWRRRIEQSTVKEYNQPQSQVNNMYVLLGGWRSVVAAWLGLFLYGILKVTAAVLLVITIILLFHFIRTSESQV